MDPKPPKNFENQQGSDQEHKTTPHCAVQLPDAPIRDINISEIQIL